MKFYIHYFILDNIILFKTKYKIYKYFFLFKFLNDKKYII